MAELKRINLKGASALKNSATGQSEKRRIKFIEEINHWITLPFMAELKRIN